ELVEDFSDLTFTYDQRRTERERIAHGAEHDVVLEETEVERVHAALADGIRPACKIDTDRKANRANIEHVRQALEPHRRLCPRFFQLAGALEQALIAIDVERREPGGAGKRVRRVGVAVEQFDDVLRPFHESVVDSLAHDNAAHRHGTRGDALGEGDHVGNYAITLRCKSMAETAIAGDHLVENKKNAVLVADRPQPLEIALRR